MQVFIYWILKVHSVSDFQGLPGEIKRISADMTVDFCGSIRRVKRVFRLDEWKRIEKRGWY